VEAYNKNVCPTTFKDPKDIREFTALSTSGLDNFFALFVQKVIDTAFPDQLFQQKIVLSILASSTGCYLFCGFKWQPFYALDLDDREKVILSWQKSYLPQVFLYCKIDVKRCGPWQRYFTS
jgi:hypothetical protein